MKNNELIRQINKYAIQLPVIISLLGILLSISIITYQKYKLEQIGTKTLKQE
jgi:hypothetical protein